MRKGCRASKSEIACHNYSSCKGRCSLGLVPATCSKIKQPNKGTKAAKRAEEVRSFYQGFVQGTSVNTVNPVDEDEGLVSLESLYGY